MKLLLTSSGNTNASIEGALLDLLDKPFSESNLVFIPTAANAEEDVSGWLENDIQNFRKLGFENFDVVDISKGEKGDWLPIFERADIFVFGGGNVVYLLEWIRKVGLDKLLLEFLKRAVYVGISAGSMVTAKQVSLSYSGILYYEDTGKFENVKGLGFVDFEIRPHLNSQFFPKVTLDFMNEIAKNMESSFYVLDDNSAVKVEDDNISVVSEGEWKKFN